MNVSNAGGIMRTAVVVCTLLVSMLSRGADATAYLVLPDGSGNFPTIQDAFYAVTDGDTVFLGDGVFTGTGNFEIDTFDKEIVLRSQSGYSESCAIDCNEHRGFIIDQAEGPGLILQGFTIANAVTNLTGAAVLIGSSAAPTIADCIFKNNNSLGEGGAICYMYTSGVVTVTGCTFLANSAVSSYGGAVSFNGDALVLDSCTFVGNYGEGGGGAVDASGDSVHIADCTFQDNYGRWGGGAA